MGKENIQVERVWKIIYVYWFLLIFRPEWLLSYYVPALSVFRSLPTILLLLLIIYWVVLNPKRYGYKGLGLFFVAVTISALLAYNTGPARVLSRTMFEYYLAAIISFSFIDTPEKVSKILKLYYVYFLFIAVWGFIGFATTGRGIVVWDWVLNEEDAYGPMMCMGFAYALKLYFAETARNSRAFALITSLCCAVGVVISFARGSFIVLVCLALLIVVQSEQRVKAFISIVFASIVILVSAAVIFPNNAFFTEMATITEGTSTGTGKDRKVLWSLAIEEYKAHPIMGVGAYNFGIVAGQYIHKVPDKGAYNENNIWGRALHNGYYQILCELGTVGVLIFLFLLYDYYKSYKFTLKNFKNIKSKLTSSALDVSQGLQYMFHSSYAMYLALIAFLMNTYFYDIIYYKWFWQLIILNRLVHIRMGEEEKDITES
jgi:O-antigen ligase